MSEQKSQLLPIKQAAAILGMAPSSLYRLCKSGRAPSYAVGAKGSGVRVNIEEVKAALRRPAPPVCNGSMP
jgi:excisionase family DNA binding protein